MSAARPEAAPRQMEEAGVAAAAVRTFADFYRQVEAGETGELPEDALEPIEDLPALDDLPASDDAPLARAVVIKLNGGPGPTLGMERAKKPAKAQSGPSLLAAVPCPAPPRRRAPWRREPSPPANPVVTPAQAR